MLLSRFLLRRNCDRATDKKNNDFAHIQWIIINEQMKLCKITFACTCALVRVCEAIRGPRDVDESNK